MDVLGTATLHQSQEYRDITLRVSTPRGSAPVLIVREGVLLNAEQIGKQVQALFEYFVESHIFMEAKASNHARCAELGICTCVR